MRSSTQQTRRETDVSWPLLFALATVIVGSLHLLRYNVIYTEGEVMQGLFSLLVYVTGGLVLVGFYRRKIAAWSIMLMGGSLLLWQCCQTRRWAMLHEEIVELVQFAEGIKTNTGRYPDTLNGFTFKSEWAKNHVSGIGTDEKGDFRIGYFLNDPGISYWYSSKTGFGYYPD